MRHSTKSNNPSLGPDRVIADKYDRIVFSEKSLGVPGVFMLGRYDSASARRPLNEHAHPGSMELCFLAKGRQTYAVKGREYRLSGGDVFAAFPDEQHSTGGRPEEKSILFWLVIDLKGQRPFLALPSSEKRELRRRLLDIRSHHFKGSPKVFALLDEIISTAQRRDIPARKSYLTGKMVELLVKVIECAEKPAIPAQGEAFAGLLKHIDENLTEKISVTDMAARAGLSASRFKAKFKKVLGVPPAEYVLRKKVEKARERLLQGRRSVTDLAFDLDFSSSQYFATVFKRYTGRNPRGFLKKQGDPS